ncbi:hypothetical protein BV25DRAFT_1027851 [Artomyces pyxidatus]|uniref:Uncharacterized protein n=1 Tax=Artomyces pyxidatus TaxID=48021 RepID=A0ACB8SUI4_9AGAM|nr:hypothetical protein BV25DRAFT_1027851 [Artomyces pyxidatus]
MRLQRSHASSALQSSIPCIPRDTGSSHSPPYRLPPHYVTDYTGSVGRGSGHSAAPRAPRVQRLLVPGREPPSSGRLQTSGLTAGMRVPSAAGRWKTCGNLLPHASSPIAFDRPGIGRCPFMCTFDSVARAASIRTWGCVESLVVAARLLLGGNTSSRVTRAVACLQPTFYGPSEGFESGFSTGDTLEPDASKERRSRRHRRKTSRRQDAQR